MATAASKALPPARSTSSPAWVASAWALLTMPWVPPRGRDRPRPGDERAGALTGSTRLAGGQEEQEQGTMELDGKGFLPVEGRTLA